MVPKVEQFKLHELWARSRNDCFLLQLKSSREISKKITTYMGTISSMAASLL